MRERLHHYRYCPQCKANVEPHFRFCRQCFFWLTRGKEEGLRQLEIKSDPAGREPISRFWFEKHLFQVSFPTLISTIMVLFICGLIASLYASTLIPTWLQWGPKFKRTTCYANMRVIQTAIEAYCLDRPFTRALASEPSKVLFESGYLRNVPSCPLAGNLYQIPRGSRLQCIGSEGHGLPD